MHHFFFCNILNSLPKQTIRFPIHTNTGYINYLFFYCATNQHTTTSPTHHHYIVGYPPLLLPFPHLSIMNNITHLHDPTTVFRHSCGTASLWTCSTSTVLPPIFSCPFLPTLPSSAVLRALRPNASLFFSVCYHWHLLFYYLFCLSYFNFI